MNTSRHPAGTSLGGQWAPGSADEIDDPTSVDDARPDQSMQAAQSALGARLVQNAKSMRAARTVLAGGETGRDLNPAIKKLSADEDYTSADTLTRYAGVRSIVDKEIADALDGGRISTQPGTTASEVFDEDSRPIVSGSVSGSGHSQTFGVSHNGDASYRVRLLHEEDASAEVTTGDRSTIDQVRVNTLLTCRVESTGDAHRDAESIKTHIIDLSEHEEASPRVVESAAHDFAAEGHEDLTLNRDLTYDEDAPAQLGVEPEVLEWES